MDTLEEIRERFKKDTFASDALGATIESVDENSAVCSVVLNSIHCNGLGEVMGGAIYTLADFAFAVASNYKQVPTVTQTSQISYLGKTKGDKLIATAKMVKSGKSTCFYIVEVKDDLGNLAAMVTMTGFRMNQYKVKKQQ